MPTHLDPEIKELLKKREELRNELERVEAELSIKHWVKVSTDWVETATQPMTDFESR